MARHLEIAYMRPPKATSPDGRTGTRQSTNAQNAHEPNPDNMEANNLNAFLLCPDSHAVPDGTYVEHDTPMCNDTNNTIEFNVTGCFIGMVQSRNVTATDLKKAPTANFVVEYHAKFTEKKLAGKVSCELTERTHGPAEWWVLVTPPEGITHHSRRRQRWSRAQ